MRHIPMIAAMFLALAISIDAQEKPADDAAKIKELIEQLGDDNPQTREAAQKSLIDLGKTSEAVFPALQATLKTSDDPEVKSRIGAIIKEIGEPEAKKAVLKALETLSTSKSYDFSCRVESPTNNIVFGGGGPGGGAVEEKNVLTLEGRHQPDAISSLKVKNEGGWNRDQYTIYQIGGCSTFKQEEAVAGMNRVVIVSLGMGLSPEELLHLDSGSWKLTEKKVISGFLSEMAGEMLVKAVDRATRQPATEKVDEKECSVFEVEVDRKKVKQLLAFGSARTIDNIRCRIAIDSERHFPLRITFNALQGPGENPLVETKGEKKPMSVIWTFDDRKAEEKVEIPEEAKRLFLGDPEVRKILGSE